MLKNILGGNDVEELKAAVLAELQTLTGDELREILEFLREKYKL